jgi:hypothetical protein
MFTAGWESPRSDDQGVAEGRSGGVAERSKAAVLKVKWPEKLIVFADPPK